MWLKPGYYVDEGGRPYYWTGINRSYVEENSPEIKGRTLKTEKETLRAQDHTGRKRAAKRGDWINRNAGPNTPQWLKDANKAVWTGVLIYGVGSIAVVVLLILFLIGLNMS